MIVVTTTDQLDESLSSFRSEGCSIGFVPTMGALHQGHISLVKQCVADNEVSVVSIFVNPTQFNDKNDLIHYPRTLDADLTLLEPTGVTVVFAPGVEDVYPEEDTRRFDFGMLDKVMEGKHRPGHFNGVAQVVSRLFDLVKPYRAYFGEKDFQQVAIIRSMVQQLNLPVEIVAMPIVREADGLALSSRNARLAPSQRKLAVKISEALTKSRNFVGRSSVQDTVNWVVDQINANEGLQVEYFEIVDGNSLQSISEWQNADYAVGCITVFCGEIRLIDNITYFAKQ
ncbi:MAG: pantoate--beta-alanine ligase [Bacteroidales bacterium 45-6]|nr:MAG: pantoate--beta-alanine ligase [Bacteroidales bacterium 45-6]